MFNNSNRNQNLAIPHKGTRSVVVMILDNGPCDRCSIPREVRNLELANAPYCCNLLTVAEGRKLPLVLDLRHVNNFLHQQNFKYENFKTASEFLYEEFYFSTFDLKCGYHHIPIHPDDRNYLGFSLLFSDGTVKYFQFVVLPVGLASACYAFIKLIRPLVTKWRGTGIRWAMYLDDGIFGSLSCTKSCSNSLKTPGRIFIPYTVGSIFNGPKYHLLMVGSILNLEIWLIKAKSKKY